MCFILSFRFTWKEREKRTVKEEKESHRQRMQEKTDRVAWKCIFFCPGKSEAHDRVSLGWSLWVFTRLNSKDEISLNYRDTQCIFMILMFNVSNEFRLFFFIVVVVSVSSLTLNSVTKHNPLSSHAYPGSNFSEYVSIGANYQNYQAGQTSCNAFHDFFLSVTWMSLFLPPVLTPKRRSLRYILLNLLLPLFDVLYSSR